MKNNPIRQCALLTLLAAMALPASAAVIPPGTQLHPTQTLIRNNGSEPETLDPALAETVGANNITRDLFEGLTANDGDGKIVPGVAESWKQTNATTWVFKLRPNARTACTVSAASSIPRPLPSTPRRTACSCSMARKSPWARSRRPRWA